MTGAQADSVTGDQLRAIMPRAPLGTALILSRWMPQYGITTRLRKAAFLATIAHECGEFRWLSEIWGPTEAQARYEYRRDLGNVQPGDGFRFRGRGCIQITGRTNYANASIGIGIDIVGNPALIETPDGAVHSACWWWRENGCNEIADTGDMRAVTRRVNGGQNGIGDRMRYYALALAAFPDFRNVIGGVL